MPPKPNRHKAAWLAALGLLLISLTGCTATSGMSANGVQAAADVLQTFAGDLLRQLLQATVL